MPHWIDEIDRIIPDIGVEVDPALRADGVGLQEAAERGGIGAGAVVIEACFGLEAPAGVAEGGRSGAGNLGLAIGPIGVFFREQARGVGQGDDGALRIRKVIDLRRPSASESDVLPETADTNRAFSVSYFQ